MVNRQNPYKFLQEFLKICEISIKIYKKVLQFKGGNKVWLLYKNILNRRLSKKLNHIKLGLFKVKKKITEVNYKLNLLIKIKIYPVQQIAMLELVHGEYKLLIYKADTYRGREEDKWEV